MPAVQQENPVVALAKVVSDLKELAISRESSLSISESVRYVIEQLPSGRKIDNNAISAVVGLVEENPDAGLLVLQIYGRGSLGQVDQDHRSKCMTRLCELIQIGKLDVTERGIEDLMFLSFSDPDATPDSILNLYRSGVRPSEISAMQEAGININRVDKYTSSSVLFDYDNPDILKSMLELADKFLELRIIKIDRDLMFRKILNTVKEIENKEKLEPSIVIDHMIKGTPTGIRLMIENFEFTEKELRSING